MKAKSSLMLVPVFAAALLAGCGSHDGNSVQAASPEQNPNGAPTQVADNKPDSPGLFKRLLSRTEPVTVSAGTPVSIRLQSSVWSATANAGDRFDFVVAEPLLVHCTPIAPAAATGQASV